MANQITGSVSLNVTNGSFVFDRSVTLDYVQSAVGGGNPGTIAVGTTEEVLGFGDITTLGYALLINLDTVNYVQYGPESGGAMVVAGRLKAGEVALLRLEPGTTYRGKANSAEVKLFCAVFED